MLQIIKLLSNNLNANNLNTNNPISNKRPIFNKLPGTRVGSLLVKVLAVMLVAIYPHISYSANTAPVIDLRPATPTSTAPAEKPEAPKPDLPKVEATSKSNNPTASKPVLPVTTKAAAPIGSKEVQSTTEAKVNSSTFKSASACSNGVTERWQKNLVATAFKRATPTQSNAGQLYEVDTLFPQLISNQLLNLHSIVQPAFLADALPPTSQYNQHQIAEINQKLARDQHSQLVLAGEILDMSMAHPNETYNPNIYHRVLNQFLDFIEVKNRFEKRDRLFHFRVQLVDGVTGEYLYTQEYRTYGVWNLTGEVRFGSEKFWQTDYGKQIGGLVKKASKDLSEVIQCQPLKSTVEARPGQTQIVLQSGANNGLRVGDTLSLYQVVMQSSETAYQQSEKRLLNRNTTVEVREIYPSHAVAMVKGTTYLSGEFLAVAQ